MFAALVILVPLLMAAEKYHEKILILSIGLGCALIMFLKLADFTDFGLWHSCDDEGIWGGVATFFVIPAISITIAFLIVILSTLQEIIGHMLSVLKR